MRYADLFCSSVHFANNDKNLAKRLNYALRHSRKTKIINF